MKHSAQLSSVSYKMYSVNILGVHFWHVRENQPLAIFCKISLGMIIGTGVHITVNMVIMCVHVFKNDCPWSYLRCKQVYVVLDEFLSSKLCMMKVSPEIN